MPWPGRRGAPGAKRGRRRGSRPPTRARSTWPPRAGPGIPPPPVPRAPSPSRARRASSASSRRPRSSPSSPAARARRRARSRPPAWGAAGGRHPQPRRPARGKTRGRRRAPRMEETMKPGLFGMCGRACVVLLFAAMPSSRSKPEREGARRRACGSGRAWLGWRGRSAGRSAAVRAPDAAHPRGFDRVRGHLGALCRAGRRGARMGGGAPRERGREGGGGEGDVARASRVGARAHARFVRGAGVRRVGRRPRGGGGGGGGGGGEHGDRAGRGAERVRGCAGRVARVRARGGGAADVEVALSARGSCGRRGGEGSSRRRRTSSRSCRARSWGPF